MLRTVAPELPCTADCIAQGSREGLHYMGKESHESRTGGY
jgi:hypothetical protein